jgi:Kef-type K+ transport system membrane component KefB
MPRTITIAACILDTAAWALVALATFFSGSDPATKGLDRAAGVAVTALFVLTGAPALGLTYYRRAPRTALMLALAFPAVLALLLVAAIVGFAG